VKENATYEETAIRELAEETQCTSDEIFCIGEFNPYNGVADEWCKVFLARTLSPTKVQHDESEEFEIIHASKKEIDEKISRGIIWDGMTIAAWMIAQSIVQ
jgi:8-oxo-dGTP pyrophosphatase MutT (NUDIX family)